MAIAADMISAWRTASLVSAEPDRNCLGGKEMEPLARTTGTGLGRSRRRRKECIQATVEMASKQPKGFNRQPYVEPRWLFPSPDGDELKCTTVGVSSSTQSSEQEIEPRTALYYLNITTSQDAKSGLSEPYAGVMVSLIGENGKAIMKRISRIESQPTTGDDATKAEFRFRFQRGAVDNVLFRAPELGHLAALWIAPESGTWRIEQATVAALPLNDDFQWTEFVARGELSSPVASEILETWAGEEWKGVVYHFGSSDALIGASVPAAELKPSGHQEFSTVVELQENLLKVWGKSTGSSLPSSAEQEVERLRSMKEYEDLKASLLGVGSILAGMGTTTLTALGQDQLAYSFAVGGVGGFIHMLLLQKAVDQLPGPHRITSEEDKQWGRGGAKLSANIALVAGIIVLVRRITHEGAVSNLTPQMLLAGVGGFLTSRVAVIIASLRSASSAGEDEH